MLNQVPSAKRQFRSPSIRSAKSPHRSADPQHGQGRARPPTDPFCQGEKVLETPKGRGGGIAETNRHLGGIRARTGYPAIRLVHTAGVARVDLLIRRVRRLSRPDCHGGGACAAPLMCRATNRLDWAADLRCGHRGSSGIPHSLSRRLIRRSAMLPSQTDRQGPIA
jgi:hypothetical protein